MKKIISLGISVLLLFSLILTGCGEKVEDETMPIDETTPVEETAPVEETEETVAETEPIEEPEPDLPEINVYIAGGTTVGWVYSDNECSYPWGYASCLEQFMNTNAIIHDHSLGGLSTKSYFKNEKYTTLMEELKEGDYLLISFGIGEFASAKEDYTNNRSFSNSLYEKLIVPAREIGAIPILCTPVVSADPNNDYTGASGQITSMGDFPQAIRDLGEALDVPVIDLNAIMREKFEEIGYEEALKYHAVRSGHYAEDNMTVIPDWDTANTQQLNATGATYVAYRLACELEKMEGIGDYVLRNKTEPDPSKFVPFAGYIAEPMFVETDKPVVYMLGDSSMERPHYANLYYRTCGYGVQIHNYFTDDVVVCNLGLGARSSRTFIEEERYNTLKNNLKEGDYVVIAFGHNDKNTWNEGRFTYPSADYTNPETFGYYLYEYYIKLAWEKGAIPILCTPIVYLVGDMDYTGIYGHITAHGSYPQVIRDLGAEFNIPVIDLTSITQARYEEIGYDEALKYHAIEVGMYAEDGVTIVPDMSTLDTTHPNVYGAYYIAYRVAQEMKNIEEISQYIKEDLVEPTEDVRVPNIYYDITKGPWEA